MDLTTTLPTKSKFNSSKFVDGNQINHAYRLSHINLDLALKKLKQKIDEQFEQFKHLLMTGVNNLNFIRYIETYPQDEIKFIFKQNIHSSISEERLNQKTQILKRMSQFEILSRDDAGVANNCLYQLQQFLDNNKRILDFKQYCPSGQTFIKRHQQILNTYVPLWKNFSNQIVADTLFKDASSAFPKQQIKKLGSILNQASKTVISAKLLYRASQNNFQSAVFKQICSGHGDTLLIAKSDKGKIFGAYTPCKWINTKQKQFVCDPTGASFLYSLDQSMIFPIKKNQLDYAISAYGGWGPIYGSPYGPDLSISDKCNLNDHSCSSLGSHYQIPVQIKQYSNEAFSLLAGSKKFKVVEYQIYQLIIK